MAVRVEDLKTKLRVTNLLSRSKIESKLIARHTDRFLNYFADQKIGILKAETEPLEQLIQEVKNNDATHFARRIEQFTRKQDECTDKSFLLHFASLAINNNNGRRSSSSKTSSACASTISEASLEDCGHMIEDLLSDIRMADKEPIENWIVTDVSIQSMKLPYGFPHSLRIPLDSSEIQNDTLIDFVENMNDKFLLLDGKFHGKIEELCLRLESNQQELLKYWPVAETALLFHVTINLKGTMSSGYSNLMREITSRLFPDKSQDEVIHQKYLLQLKQALEERRENTVRDWVREKVELQTALEHEWETTHEQMAKKIEYSRIIKRQQKRCIELTAKLHLQAKARAETQAQVKALAAPILREEEAKKSRLKQMELERQEQVREDARRYKQSKLHQQQLNQQRLEVHKLALERFKQEAMTVNKSRVNFRHGLLKQKASVHKMAEEKKRASEARRLKLLEDMKYKQEVHYDPDNVFAETHASHVRRFETKQRLEARAENKVDLVAFFRDTYFFSSESVLKDRRARLENKLREAGLIKSSYARQILIAMQPEARPHLKTQIRLGSSED